MNRPEDLAFWAAFRRAMKVSADYRQAIFREHFLDIHERDTSREAKVEVARLIGDMRLKGELQ